MPDWYVQKNSDDARYPFQVRLGGCEYSLSHEEWAEFFDAMLQANQAEGELRVESEEYKDIVIASATKEGQAQSLLALMGIKKPEPERFGGM